MLRVFMLVVFALMAQSCAREPIGADPPPACATAQRLYILGHGWHTGIVVNRSDLVELVPSLAPDLPAFEHLEIGWGDEAFYQAQRGTLGLALRALFQSQSSALQVVPFSGPPHQHFPQSAMVELCADENAYRAVVSFVARSFMLDQDNRVIRLGRSQYGSGWFYRAEGAFSARNTCNTWVAKALAQAGYPVSTSAVRAEELLAELRALRR
jgi:uncharacterized protein (TIGR02117 family)